MERTGAIAGVSKGWASHLRSEFIRTKGAGKKRLRGGRRRENISFEEEVAFLAPFFEKASKGGILVVSEIKQELDKRLGRRIALASTIFFIVTAGESLPRTNSTRRPTF